MKVGYNVIEATRGNDIVVEEWIVFQDEDEDCQYIAIQKDSENYVCADTLPELTTNIMNFEEYMK